MAAINLKMVYEVPSRVDNEGHLWYRCLDDMHFATARIGWAVGSEQILHTQDGGKTWVNQYRDHVDHTYLSPHRVFTVNTSTGWIIAIGSGTGIRCCYTRDGGDTWKGKEFESELHPNDISFIDSKRGWIASDDGRVPVRSGKIYWTKDQGDTWDSYDSIIEGKPHRIRFINPKKGWLIRTYLNQSQTKTISELLVTEDRGRSWQSIQRFDREISELCPLNEKRLIVAGESGFIAETKDAGKNWKRLATRSRAFINAVRFYNNRTAIAVGDYNTVLLSEDGGEMWEKIKQPGNVEHFIDAHFTSRMTGIIATSTKIYSFKIG